MKHKKMIQCATLGIPKGMKKCNFQTGLKVKKKYYSSTLSLRGLHSVQCWGVLRWP